MVATGATMKHVACGGTLLEMVLALLLGTMTVVLATSSYVSSSLLARQIEERLTHLQRIRLFLSHIVRDLRMAGRFGCAPRDWQGVSGVEGLPLTLRYAGQVLPIRHISMTDDRSQVRSVRIDAASDPLQHQRQVWVVASCTRYDIVLPAEGVQIEHDDHGAVQLIFSAGHTLPLMTDQGTPGGHHLPSLQVMTLVEHRYQLHPGGDLQRVTREETGAWSLPFPLLERVRQVRLTWPPGGAPSPTARVHFYLELASAAKAMSDSYEVSIALQR